jgi:hypothetical protein
MSIPELAEQMGHAPQMTVMTYTHVIRELRGSREPLPSSRSNELGAMLVDPRWTLRRVQGASRERAPVAKCLHTGRIAPGGFEPPTSRL